MLVVAVLAASLSATIFPPGIDRPHLATDGKMRSQFGGARQCQETDLIVSEVTHPLMTAKFSWGQLDQQHTSSHVLTAARAMSFAAADTISFHHIDSRTSMPVAATQGGDIGEFILALTAYERFRVMKFDEEQVEHMLLDYLVSLDIPSFALELDDGSLSLVCQAGCCLPSCRIDAVTPDLSPAVTNALLSPEAQSSGFLSSLIRQPKRYGTHKGIVRGAVRAFLGILWGRIKGRHSPASLALAQSKLRLYIVTGSRRGEGALLHVHSTACGPARVPLLSPEIAGSSLLIQNDDAAQYRRQVAAQWLAEMAVKMHIQDGRARDSEALLQQMNSIASLQYQITRADDSGKTPVFEVTFPPVCCAI